MAEPSEQTSNRPATSVLEQALLLIVVVAIALVGNRIGPDNGILEALPGMFILYVITVVGLLITKYAPLRLPGVAWIALVATIMTLPWVPGSAWIVEQVSRVDFLALATPVLAYAGLAISKREIETFTRSGWRIVIVALAVFIGTFVGSAAIAHIVMRLQGLI